MADNTTIEWTRGPRGEPGATWNPLVAFDRVTHRRGWACVHASPGCAHCYAEAVNRWRGTGRPYTAVELARVESLLLTGSRGQSDVTWPIRAARPRFIFPCSMTDAWGAWVSDPELDLIHGAMLLAPQHTFQWLTKWPERRRAYVTAPGRQERVQTAARVISGMLWPAGSRRAIDAETRVIQGARWPLPHVWQGVSAEDQRRYDERWPALRDTPAPVRFLSYEPALGPLVLSPDALAGTLHWALIGGESGPEARDFHLAWADSILAQTAGTPVRPFVKQLGRRPLGAGGAPLSLVDRKGGQMEEWPLHLWVREYPAVPEDGA